MKIGLYGGTFDPLHNAHAELIRAALASRQIDQLIVMPSGRPPHKNNETVSLAGYRYEMACLAFGEQAGVQVSDLEILRAGPSYTLDTIRQLQDKLPADSELFLVFGSDILQDIENWYEPAAIMTACPLLLASRGGIDDRESLMKAQELTRHYGARISFFPSPDLDLSSTMIRQAVCEGKAFQQWVPERIARFIKKNGLYRYQDDLARLPPDLRLRLADLERQIWPLLDRKRLLHSLNVMVYALHLATIHQVDLVQTCIAALLHDCAKDLPKPEVREYATMSGDLSLLDRELAHGPAGAWLARTRFGIDDPDILRAIQYHTTGCPGMTPLDKIIFIADKVEPARIYENLTEIRRLVEFDLDGAMRICLGEIDCFLRRERLPPHPYTKIARDELDSSKTGQSGRFPDEPADML